MFGLSLVMNILGCLSHPHSYHFDHFWAFLTYFGVFKKFANYGLKTENWLWYPSYSDSAPSNYIKNIGYRLLPQNAWGSSFFWFLTWLLLQTPLTNLKWFGDRAFCAYSPRLWNELPDNTKAADSVQNFKKQLKTLLFRKEFNWLPVYGPWQLSNDYKALLNIIGGMGAISNINYYYYLCLEVKWTEKASDCAVSS